MRPVEFGIEISQPSQQVRHNTPAEALALKPTVGNVFPHMDIQLTVDRLVVLSRASSMMLNSLVL